MINNKIPETQLFYYQIVSLEGISMDYIIETHNITKNTMILPLLTL